MEIIIKTLFLEKTYTTTANSSYLYTKIKNILKEEPCVNIDFSNMSNMTSKAAQDIFGKLYVELGAQVFHNKINFLNIKTELKPTLKYGIMKTLREN